ncbi:MAG: hypothetical protein GF341_00135 [candidate division Zixibacteria bacterium]|nr:hypothetical protein [candidate division Zixibacteria bacterium]
MIIARVSGHIVSTAKNPKYKPFKILRCVPERLDGAVREDAAPIVALDTVDAGVGDRVLICQEGKWAREYLGDMDAPVRSMVVGVVERIEVGAPPNLLP